MDIQPQKLGIIGATGLVGTLMIKILAERNFPVKEFRAYASPKSIGKRVENPWEETFCQELNETCFDGLDILIVDVDDPIAAEWVPVAAKAGVKVVDKSAYFRMDDDVPLVIPEINGDDIKHASRNIISNPNCTTTVMLMGLYALHNEWGLDRVVVSSYQSVSGAGISGIEELDSQNSENISGNQYVSSALSENLLAGGQNWSTRIAGNVIPLAGSIKEQDYTSEEWKLVKETQKILHDDTIKVSATCARVPVFVGHSMSISATFKSVPNLEQAASILASTKGVQFDKTLSALHSAGIDDVLVGRLRQDIFLENTLNLWAVGDNIRKGAALNAAQIAEAWCV